MSSEDDPYFNPRVKVRFLSKSIRGRFHSRNRRHDFKIEQEWAIYEDGERTEFRIVRSAHPNPYLTMIDGTNTMVEAWHIGVSPGNLARLIMKRRSEKEHANG